MSAVDAIPEDACLLHVGMRKTGSTSLQKNVASVRTELADRGVLYPGTEFKQRQLYVGLHRDLDLGAMYPEIASWPGRVFVSNEAFDFLTPLQISKLASFLNPAKLHVVLATRPLNESLPSLWQQRVKLGKLDQPLGPWLMKYWQAKKPAPWVRPDIVASRWAEVLGPERVTVVLHKSDTSISVAQVIHELLALPPDTIPSTGNRNRGLTLQEAEFVRLYRHSELAGSTPGGLGGYLQARPADPREARARVPITQFDQVSRAQSEIASNLAAVNCQIVGDLAGWGQVEPESLASDLQQIADIDNGAAMIPADAAWKFLGGRQSEVATTKIKSKLANRIAQATQQLRGKNQ